MSQSVTRSPIELFWTAKNDDVIYEPKGVQFVDIYITLHYALHYIRSSLAVCVYGCLPYETKSRPHIV